MAVDLVALGRRLLPLAALGGILAWTGLRIRKRAETAPSVLVCVACEQSVAGRAGHLACPRCGGALEDVRGFYDRHPERK